MSHRTILEFNHDYLHDMAEDPEFGKKLLQKLMANDWKGRWTGEVPGVHKVGERHHSESLVIEVNGHRTDARC
jgi:hypothetical protein